MGSFFTSPHKYIRLFILFCVAVGALHTVKSPAQEPYIFQTPKYEVRAVWLTTIGGIDWPHSYAKAGSTGAIAHQQQELCQILDQLKRANVNTVLIQTRVRATTIFPSAYEPWDGCLSGHPGVSPGYDALQFAIDECHRRGMECHAWVVTIPVGKWNKAGCQRLRQTHPELLRKIGDEGFLNPEHYGTGPYLAKLCAEITRRYDIDGIHLDYIRYPETWKIKVPRHEGRENITRIVREISNAVKAEKPWVKVSCSPVGKFSDLTRHSSQGWNAYHTVCQDVQEWLRRGYMDQLYPMMYFRDNQFYPFAVDWAQYSYGRTVAPGLGIYFLDPREGRWQLQDITRELHALRQMGLGHTYFRSKFFTDNIRGIYNYVCKYVDLYPALVPPMTWQNRTIPPSPTSLQVKVGNGQTVLTWRGQGSTRQGTGTSPQASDTYYNVYASKTYPVNTEDARNIVAQRVQGNCLYLRDNAERFYAVTAVNRYGNESIPLQSWQKIRREDAFLLDNDGRTLVLPPAAAATDARFVTIETLQGNIVTTMSLSSKLDIRNLPEGVYVVRTLGKKSITHRLGMFLLKR